MSLKRLLLLAAVVLGLFLGAGAQEKPDMLEHIFWKMGGFFNETTLSGPGPFGYESPLFMSIQVPPSPKSDEVFFEFGVQSSVQWMQGVTQSFWSGYRFVFKSSVIPANISVENTTSLDGVNDPGLFRQGQSRTDKTTYRWTVVRDGFLKDYVFLPLSITYVDSGQLVPNDLANDILNSLLDNGFEVDITVVGVARGVQSFYLVSGWMDVTRSVKK